MQDRDIVGVGEIAAQLGVKVDTVEKWRKRGQLPPPNGTIGKALWWHWSDVEHWATVTGRPKRRKAAARITG